MRINAYNSVLTFFIDTSVYFFHLNAQQSIRFIDRIVIFQLI